MKQSFTDWELLIIDDGSTDKALDGIADLRDERIKIYSDGRNLGLAARLNQACAMASGKYLARMDQDDVSYPGRLLLQVQALQKNPGLDLVAARAVTIDENNQINGMLPFAGTHEEICANPWRGFYFPHPAWLGRLEWFRQHRYAQPAPYFCEDQELLLRCYQQSRFLALDDILLAYRIRKHLNRTKLARTRRALLAVKWRFFVASAMWDQMFLALIDYVVKWCAGLLRRDSSSFFFDRVGVSSQIKAEWYRTLDSYAEKHS